MNKPFIALAFDPAFGGLEALAAVLIGLDPAVADKDRSVKFDPLSATVEKTEPAKEPETEWRMLKAGEKLQAGDQVRPKHADNFLVPESHYGRAVLHRSPYTYPEGAYWRKVEEEIPAEDSVQGLAQDIHRAKLCEANRILVELCHKLAHERDTYKEQVRAAAEAKAVHDKADRVCVVERNRFEKLYTEAQQSATAWQDTAMQYARNTDFYCGIVNQIGEMFGDLAKTADDGSLSEDVIALKVPELVKDLIDGKDYPGVVSEYWEQKYGSLVQSLVDRRG